MRSIQKAVLCIGISLAVVAGKAQLILQPTVPRLGIIQKSQLWNMVMINPTEEATVRIDLVLQDRQSGHTLMVAQSGNIKLPKGARQLSEQVVFPVQYRYEAIFNNSNKQALLPVGHYQACYTIVRLPKEEPAGQECVPIDVTPLAPPQLIYPSNQVQLLERAPQLIWAPPTPAVLFNQLRYEVLVTEVYGGQSPAEAIQRNNPLFAIGGVPQQSIAYPASATRLDTGKVYAWQVIAKNGESYAANSDVWTFTLRKDSAGKTVSTAPYLKMNAETAAPGWAEEGILKLEYIQESADPSVSIDIYDLRKTEKPLHRFNVPTQYGQNFMVLDLHKALHLKEGECYQAKISRPGQATSQVRFFVRYHQQAAGSADQNNN